MVEVKLILQDKNERLWFIRMLDDLEEYRTKKNSPAEPPPVDEPILEAEPTGEPAVVGHIDAEGGKVFETPQEAGVPTEAELYEALREYVREPGYAPARALLTKYGVDKITDPMSSEVKVKLYAELTAK
jgi:hypothetical protein